MTLAGRSESSELEKMSAVIMITLNDR